MISDIYSGVKIQMEHSNNTSIYARRVITFENSTFNNNSASSLIIIEGNEGAHEYSMISSTQFEVVLRACTFTNSAMASNTFTSSVANVNKVTIIDCKFEHNKGTAIMAESSNLMFEGTNIFRNNS